jgi:hypothetical protein
VTINIGLNSSAQIPASGLSDPTNCSMSQGSTGDAVKRLQQNLNQCYSSQLKYGISGSGLPYPGALLSEDGQFGPNTYKGLRLAQYYESQAGPAISVDGMYGPQTRSALRWWGTYYTANDQPRTGCARVVMPIQILSTTPPPPPPPPVTRYMVVQANDFINTDYGCVRQPWNCDAGSILTFQNIDGWVSATRSGSRETFSASGGWQIEPTTQLLTASFFLQIWDCTTHARVPEDVINAYEQPIDDKSGTLYRSTFTVDTSHTYEARFFGSGDLYSHPASHFFGYNTPEQQILAPELNGVITPLYVSTGCF